MKKYIVQVSISYIDLEFVFDDWEEAGMFMNQFLDHLAKDDDGRGRSCRVSVRREIVDDNKNDQED